MAKGKVTVDQNACKGCRICVHVCPKQVLEINQNKINVKGYSPSEPVRPEDCIACGNCAIMCPDSCITVVRE